MPDALARTEPVPLEAVKFTGASVALEQPLTRYSLRARDRAMLEEVTGRALPDQIGAISNDALMLGPDEWLLRLPVGTHFPSGGDQPVSVVDISERQVAIAVEGARAVEVLQGGNPLDLERFPVGSGKRTIFEGVEITLIRESENRFIVEVWRSFADFVWGVLVKSASEE